MSRDYDDGFDDGYNDIPIRPNVPRGPGTFLMVSGALSMIGGILTVIMILFAYEPFLSWAKQQEAKAAQGAEKEKMQMQIKQMEQSKLMSQTAYTTIGGAGAILGFIIMLAGNSMRKGNSYTFSMVGTILAFIPIANCCCVLTMPAGIVAMISLLKPETKAAFSNRRMDTRNGYHDSYDS